MRPAAVAIAALLCLSSGLAARPAAAADKPVHPSPQAASDEPGRGDRNAPPKPGGEALEAVKAPVDEATSVTHGTAQIGGQAIAYTATAGTLTLRDDDSKPTASMFYVAYTADGARGHNANRPITFMYNGGPGSSSMWLHLGSFGPVRVTTDAPQPNRPAPFGLVNNTDSLLDKSDIVFIDAIGTGFSRTLGQVKGTDFWGVDQDADAFARGIIRYLTINGRWNSPKFLFGESYGTTRSAALVYQLQERGVEMNGVVLLSSILNYGVRLPGFDHLYVTYLPTYAAAAWYHNRIPNRPADLGAFLHEVRDYAEGPYLTALTKGDNLSPQEKDAVARQLAAYTGVSADYYKKADLRVDLSRFRKELLRDQDRTIGRLDSRFMGIDVDAVGESPENDPADTGVSGPFIGAINDYLRNRLGYKTDLTYRPNYYSQVGRNWDFKHKAPGGQRPEATADVAQDLAAAMRENPHLKVLSLNGYYDMATPFFGAEYDLFHMQLDDTLKPNLKFAYYPSGHMVYLNPDSLRQMKADLVGFYDEAAPGS